MSTAGNRASIRTKDIRVFVAFLSVIGFAVIVSLWAKGRMTPAILFVAGGVNIAFAFAFLLFPMRFAPIYRAWMMAAVFLGKINTAALLLIAYFAVFYPIGIMMRLFGKDLLAQNVHRDAPTYWNDCVEDDDESRFDYQS